MGSWSPMRWERDGSQTSRRGGYRLPLSQKSDIPVKALLPRPPIKLANCVEIHSIKLNIDVLSYQHSFASFTDVPFPFCVFRLCSHQDNSTMLRFFFCIKSFNLFPKGLNVFLHKIRFYNLSFFIYINIVVSYWSETKGLIFEC